MVMPTNLVTELDPFPFYRKMRQANPVYLDLNNENWNIFCYEDVQRVLSDYETFSSQFQGAGSGNIFAASIISTDPPRHRKLRSLVTQAFTPRAVEALAPRIDSIVSGILDNKIPAGQMDIIQDLGYPLPVIVIAEMLGIPASDREKFKTWSDILVSMGNMGDSISAQEFQTSPVMEMSAYFFNMIEKRRSQPEDDLISALLAANVDGDHLELIELLGFCALLLVAGNETTTNLIGNAMDIFAEYPEAWARLRAAPELLPQAIEEVLRFRSPVQSMFRVTRSEVTLSDQRIPAGESITAWIGSANHDEDQFPDSERFILDRTPNRHLAFGHGIHYCLGAPLARLEAKIALGAMLQRFSAFSIMPGVRLERHPSSLVYGLKSIPIMFTNG
jgi:cytochrome P450